MPGHEVHVIRALVDHVGSVRNLREVVEQYTGKTVDMSTVLESIDQDYHSTKARAVNHRQGKYK